MDPPPDNKRWRGVFSAPLKWTIYPLDRSVADCEDPSQFTPIITAYAFMAVIAGGRGSNLGLVLGAGSIMLILEATRFLKDVIPGVDGVQLSALRLGMIGVGIVLLLILRPEGLVSEPKRRFADFFPPESEKA